MSSYLSLEVYPEIMSEFMEYIAVSPLLAHNAKFDMRMLNAEPNRRNSLPHVKKTKWAAMCNLKGEEISRVRMEPSH